MLRLDEDTVARFWKSFEKTDGCWLWRSVDPGTYGRMKVEGRDTGAHRVSFVIHGGVIPRGMLVCHTCDVPACVNPKHLFVGSVQDNAIDCVAKNRCARKAPLGQRNARARLTEEDVRMIRAYPKVGMREMARKLGVHYRAVWSVRHGETWKHVV